MTRPAQREDARATPTTSPGTARRRLRPPPVAAVCAALLGAPLLAFAQATPAADAQKLDTVTVSGFRASLETSISTKRNADAIVEPNSA